VYPILAILGVSSRFPVPTRPPSLRPSQPSPCFEFHPVVFAAFEPRPLRCQVSTVPLSPYGLALHHPSLPSPTSVSVCCFYFSLHGSPSSDPTQLIPPLSPVLSLSIACAFYTWCSAFAAQPASSSLHPCVLCLCSPQLYRPDFFICPQQAPFATVSVDLSEPSSSVVAAALIYCHFTIAVPYHVDLPCLRLSICSTVFGASSLFILCTVRCLLPLPSSPPSSIVIFSIALVVVAIWDYGFGIYLSLSQAHRSSPLRRDVLSQI
jgi:hypothetical protein